MIFGIIVLFLMACLFLVSSGERLPRGCAPARWQILFYRASCYLLRRLRRRGKQEKITAFETERLAGVLMAVCLGGGASLLIWAAAPVQSILGNGYELERPDVGEGSYVQELQVQFEDNDQTEQMEITVAERHYTEEEQEAYLTQALEEIEAAVLGENTSPDEVRGRVFLPAKLADGNVSAEWTQEPAGLLDADGNILEGISSEGEVLQLSAVLVCGNRQRIYECALRLLPPLYSEEEKLRRALESEVEKADESSAQENRMALPREVQGRRIVWEEPHTSAAGVGAVLTLLAAVLAWSAKNRERQKEGELRRRQMILDYPDLLFKLSMLLNSGMTMQAAFFRIALEYRSRTEGGVRYAYEEMLTAYYEMKSGVPEARAYENFGRRCQLESYNKLGMMLSSNLQKGSEGLAKILQELAVSAMEERRQMAKKLGEEAGTRLLLPMMLMLLVVLVILMAPAIMAF